MAALISLTSYLIYLACINLKGKMAFGLLDLIRLKLTRQTVPEYSDLSATKFPEKIPSMLIFLCFANSILKLSIPLILEETYSQLSSSNTHNNYILLIIIAMLALGISQLILIAYNLMLSLYRSNVKRQLSSRIIKNNYLHYKNSLESLSMTEQPNNISMDLWIKIMTKLSVYLHNYYQSTLSLIFQCFNIFFITIYLFYKLSFALFFGLAIAALVMYKTLVTTNQMQTVRFNNIELRARRLKILEAYFGKITQFKMTWLDKWIYDRVTMIEHLFQDGLREIKILDCWCVALWQFTGVGISAIVIIAYYVFGISSDPQSSVITPSTFIYMLNMLNFPLNALSWYIAGIKTANRAISELSQDIIIHQQSQNSPLKPTITEQNNSLLIKKEISILIEHQNNLNQKELMIPLKQFRKNQIYSIQGDYSEYFMSKFVFLLQEKIVKSYVEENGWLPEDAYASFEMGCTISQVSSLQINEQVKLLMQLFQLGDIPLQNNTKNYSGGEKLRVSLVRAFHLGQVIIINTNLNSLDSKMKQKIKENLNNLINNRYASIKKQYTIFIRENQDIAHQIISITQRNKGKLSLTFTPHLIKRQYQNDCLHPVISHQIIKYLQSQKQYTQKQASQQTINLSPKQPVTTQQSDKQMVNLQTFKLYYKSPKHLYFIISLIFVTFLSNYYNYYLNTYIRFSQCTLDQILCIVIITIVFAFGLFFRSYLFADANLEESKRICHHLNRNIIMHQLEFYHYEHIGRKAQEINSKSRLICALTTDTETIADHFPFTTNIFANNVTTILSAILIIIIEVPQILVLIFFLVLYANRLNQTSHKKDQFLKLALKEKEQQLYKIISQIEADKKYIVIHHKFSSFYHRFQRVRQEYISIEWQNEKYRNYINLKYKMVMMLFLAIGILFYSFFNVLIHPQEEEALLNNNGNKNTSSGLALLIQYTVQLSNYLLYFTMSIWEIKGQALSLQRVKDYLQSNTDIESRINSSNKILAKLNHPNQSSLKTNDEMIDIRDLTFAYKENPNSVILDGLNLHISKGSKVVIRGKSGGGKTTLYKLMTSTYPEAYNLIDLPFSIAYSPQHPLLLPDTTSLQQNINPYKIDYNMVEVEKMKKQFNVRGENVLQLSSEQQLVINNIRAYLYSRQGLTIYDQPKCVFQHDEATYLIVTHHDKFKCNQQLQLINGQLLHHNPC